MNLGFNSMLYEGLRGRKIKTAIFSKFLEKPKKQQTLLIMTNMATFKSDLGCSASEPF